jgi:transcriptional regulator with XRE-family HTH domain
MTMTLPKPGAGQIIREWRTRRRLSQLELALDAGISTRHLSFVETGRSRASRELLLELCEHLEVPLREQNTMLLAAGFAPVYRESAMEADGLGHVREALQHLLAGHDPFPALVVDRCGDVLMTNRAVDALLAPLDPAVLAPPVNIYRLSLAPGGLAPHVVNIRRWAGHLHHRLERLADLTGDPRVLALRDEVAEHAHAIAQGPGGDAGPRVTERSAQVMLPLHLRHPAGELRMYSTITHFGAAWDVTVSELSVETFVPADSATRTVLASLVP